MHRTACAAFLAFSFSFCCAAQERKPPQPPAATRKQPPAFHLKMRVRLKNGRVLVGIVRAGRLYEKLVVEGPLSPLERFLERTYGLPPISGRRRTFVPARPKDPAAGLRLWHYDETGGYLFVPYRAIASVERLRLVSPAELAALDAAARARRQAEAARLRAVWQKRQERERKRLRALRKKQAEARRKQGGGKRPDAGGVAGTLDEEARKALFARFHPSRGWTPGRKAVIEWRQVTLGVFPTPEEREWLRHYSAWKKEYDRWLQARGGKKEEPSGRSAP